MKIDTQSEYTERVIIKVAYHVYFGDRKGSGLEEWLKRF